MDQFSIHPTDVPSFVAIKDVTRTEPNNNSSIEPAKQSFSGEDMEAARESSSHTSIDSDIIRFIDQGFADYMSKSKSLQRVESRYDPIPRYFFIPKGKDNESHVKTPHLPNVSPSYQIFPDVKDVEEETTQSSSSLIFEKSSKLISADNHSNDNDDHDNGKGNAEICDKNRISSPPPKLDSSYNMNKGKHAHNEVAKSQNASQSSIMSMKTLNDNDNSAVSSSAYKSISDDQILELKQPQMSSSITLSINSVASNATNIMCRSIDDELDNNGKQECSIPSKTIQVSSQDSLRQIESFHRDFVGNLSLLSGTTVFTDEKKTLTDPLVEGKGDTLEGNCSDNKENVGEQIKNCGKSPLGEEEKILRDQNLHGSEKADGISSKVDLNPPTPSHSTAVGSNMTEDNNNDAIIEPTACERADQQPLSSPACEKDSGCPSEKITSYVNEYIESLEQEWQIRRNVWLENNKHNPDCKRGQSSIYACETFRDYMVNTNFIPKIDLQFPFNLPEVAENNGNPILLDQILPLQPLPESSPKKLKKPEKPSQIPKMNVVGGTSGIGRSAGRNVIDSGYNVVKPRVTNDVPPVKIQSSSVQEEKEIPRPSSVTNMQMGTEDVIKGTEEQEATRPSPDLNKSNKEDDFWDELKNAQTESNYGTDKMDELIDSFVKKHVDFLETEWSRRRDVWLANNMYDGDSLYQSFKTFKKALAAKQIPHQFPFQLPDINATKKIILDDEDQNLIRKNDTFDEIKEVGDTTNYAAEEAPPTKLTFSKEDLGQMETVDDLKRKDVCEEDNELLQVPDKDSASFQNLHPNVADHKIIDNMLPTHYEAHINGRTVLCTSLDQKTRLEVCHLKLSTRQTYARNLKDMTSLPGVKILEYLSLADFKNCRLVSKSWNTAVITYKRFLSTTTFVVEKKQQGALATLEASRVQWQHLRCAMLPSTNFTTSTSYNSRYLSSLRVTPMSSRNEPVMHSLTSVILENIAIYKQQLVQWIQNCKRLNSIEIRDCNLLKTSISMNLDKTNRVMERVQVMKFTDMDTVKLVEALRFFLPSTRRLHTLEIIQKKESKRTAKSTTLTGRKRVEDSILAVLLPALKKNASTLKNIRFEFCPSTNCLLQTKIMEIFQDASSQFSRSYIFNIGLDS